jgi:small subunit ribosomal protein S4
MSTENLCRLCRREGEKLFLKGEKCLSPRCPFVRRSYAPGQHGQYHKKLSDYGKQLREKQKAKRIYGLRETQFKNYYKKASQQSGDTSELLLSFLERRLDNVVYRLGLANSRKEARQLLSHGHFLVNQKRVNNPSYLTKAKDKITVADKSLIKKSLKRNLKNIVIPPWLKLDEDKLEGEVLHLPKKEEIETNIDPAYIIEFYSR